MSRINSNLGVELTFQEEYPNSEEARNGRSEIDHLKHRISELVIQVCLLRAAAKSIYYRRQMVSGSLEMAECDELCKSVGLEPWKWTP